MAFKSYLFVSVWVFVDLPKFKAVGKAEQFHLFFFFVFVFAPLPSPPPAFCARLLFDSFYFILFRFILCRQLVNAQKKWWNLQKLLHTVVLTLKLLTRQISLVLLFSFFCLFSFVLLWMAKFITNCLLLWVRESDGLRYSTYWIIFKRDGGKHKLNDNVDFLELDSFASFNLDSLL